MRTVTLALACLASVASSSAYAQDAAVEAPINTFLTAFNKGNTATALTAMADPVTITDEFAPYQWVGTDAFATWAANYETDAKAKGITDPSVTLKTPTRELIDGEHAYVVVPATYRFMQKGVKMVEVAQMTFSLAKGANGWRISGWTWTGPTASPVK